jgi:hypothetical protein
MGRLKALYRSQAIACAGKKPYGSRHREEWLVQLTNSGLQRRAWRSKSHGPPYAPRDIVKILGEQRIELIRPLFPAVSSVPALDLGVQEVRPSRASVEIDVLDWLYFFFAYRGKVAESIPANFPSLVSFHFGWRSS